MGCFIATMAVCSVFQRRLEAFRKGSQPMAGPHSAAMATRDYAPGEAVLTVPMGPVITMATVLESQSFGDAAAAIGM
jgi:hypothetical protein